MNICGVISEIDIKNVIRLRLAIEAGFIEAREIKGLLLIRNYNKYQTVVCCTKKMKFM